MARMYDIDEAGKKKVLTLRRSPWAAATQPRLLADMLWPRASWSFSLNNE